MAQSAGESIGTGAASGAVGGAGLGPAGAIAGLGIGAIGGGLNYLGGRKAARAAQARLDRYNNRRKELMGELQASQFANTQRKQRALGDYIGTMPTNGAEQPIRLASAELPAGGPANLDPELAAIYQAQAGRQTGLADVQTQAQAAAARRARWLQALSDNGDNIQAGQLVGDNQVIRDRQALAEALARNEAEYNGSGGAPNSAYNLQLLGSLLSAGGNAGIQIAGRSGGGTRTPAAGIPRIDSTPQGGWASTRPGVA